MALLSSGSLNKRVTLLSQSTVQNASGGVAVDPSGGDVFATVWARISPMSGSESYRYQQFTAEANVTVVIRWRPGVLSNMAVQYQGIEGIRNFLVMYVLNENEQNVQLTLLCKEINDQ